MRFFPKWLRAILIVPAIAGLAACDPPSGGDSGGGPAENPTDQNEN